MQTPRRQALLATLTGVLAGITALGVVVVIRSATAPAERASSTPATSTPVPSTPPSPGDGPLDPARLSYGRKSLGGGMAVDVPAGWQTEQDSSGQARFVDGSGTWLLRLDGRSSDRSIEKMLAARQRSVRRSPDLRIVRRDSGTEPVSWNGSGLTHRTLVYTYTNDSRGQRMVMSRWISLDGGDRTAVEITVGGRPQDEAGLAALLARATKSLVLAT